jgi:tetratricopeptide (TPR) repeat protein
LSDLFRLADEHPPDGGVILFNLKLSRSLLAVFSVGALSGAALAQYSSQPSTNLPSHMPTETRRPVSISGQVVLEDGTPSREPVEILRVCGSMVRREVYTDAKGKFSIVLDENSTNKTFQGASEGGGTGDFGAQLGNRVSTTTRTQLWGCEIRAALPGYTSSAVSLQGRDFSVPVTIAPIVLRRSTGAEANLFSAVSAKAPEDARKEFEKGRDDFLKKKYSDADKHLAKAIDLYPQYSSAMELRGRTQRLLKQDPEAEKSFLAAINVDEKFVPPYIQLAGLNAGQSRWDNVLLLTGKVIEFDPMSYPDAYFLNAFAHFNLKEMAEAEATAKKAVEIDKDHRFPRAELLLGKILQSKGENVAAAEHFRNYVKMEPTSPEIKTINEFLAKVQQDSATANAAPKSN